MIGLKFAMRIKNLICGFSGSGKTTLVNELSKVDALSAYSFYDLDQEILKELNAKSIREVIDRHSWEFFRENEQRVLRELIEKNQSIFISLGGGSLNSNNYEKYAKDETIQVYWLDTPFLTCLKRIKESEDRPLSDMPVEEYLSLYENRCEIYQKFKRIQSISDIVSD